MDKKLPPEILKKWQASPNMGPLEQRVCYEFMQRSDNEQVEELGAWLLSRLGAILKDAKEAEKTEAANTAST